MTNPDDGRDRKERLPPTALKKIKKCIRYSSVIHDY
jgi:hypothetical protein